MNIPIGEATSKPRVVTRTTYFGREDMKILFLLKKVREVSVKSTLNRVKDSLITSTITCCWKTFSPGRSSSVGRGHPEENEEVEEDELMR